MYLKLRFDSMDKNHKSETKVIDVWMIVQNISFVQSQPSQIYRQQAVGKRFHQAKPITKQLCLLV